MAADAFRHGLSVVRRVVAVVALSTTLVLGSSLAAHADPDWGGGVDDGGVDVGGEDGGSETTPGGGNGGTQISVPGPWTQRVYVPACDRNSVTATGPGVGDYETVNDVLCTAFDAACPADEDRRYYVFERRMGPDNRARDDNFSANGSVCRSINDPDETQPPTITVDQIIDQARALAPTPTFVIEPGDRTYVNVPTNFAADVAPVTVNVEVLGFTIPVEFTPGDVTWSFGDGGSGSGVGIRNASVGQSGAVEHAYVRSGQHAVSVTVAYDARIFVPNGDPITFDTPITRSSAPQSLEVGEIQSVVTQVD